MSFFFKLLKGLFLKLTFLDRDKNKNSMFTGIECHDTGDLGD